MTLHSSLIRPEIAGLPTYNAGLAASRFQAVYGVPLRAKLDSNENPLGPSPAAIAAALAAAQGLGRYPDASGTALRTALADRLGASPDRIILGNGSEDLIGVIYRTVLRPGDHVVTVCPSFGLHEFAALACGARVTKVPFPADWRFPVEGLLAAMATGARVLIFSSPANPAGPAITRADFTRLIAGTPPDTLVVFDEAYVEYLDPEARFDALAMLAASGLAWISLRTFSKAYGLAGARVGYGVAHAAGLVAAMAKARNPFAVNAVAEAAALAALGDDGHLAQGLALTRSERRRVSAALAATGVTCAPSQTNFLFFDCGGPATATAELLRQRGILIKAWMEPPFGTWARVTMGTLDENDLFLGALHQIRESRQPEVSRPALQVLRVIGPRSP